MKNIKEDQLRTNDRFIVLYFKFRLPNKAAFLFLINDKKLVEKLKLAFAFPYTKIKSRYIRTSG